MSATNRGLQRQKNDYYPTPIWLVEAVIPLLKSRLEAAGVCKPRIFEPAAGEALAIVRALLTHWEEAAVDYSDIIPELGGVDFLLERPEPIYDIVITNPPYILAEEFCRRAMLWRRNEQSLVVMLLRLNFLGSKTRAAWLRDNLPAVAVTPKRPSFGLNKHGKPATDASEYAWFIWPYDQPYLSILETENIEGR